jgi:hypothetical protein
MVNTSANSSADDANATNNLRSGARLATILPPTEEAQNAVTTTA